MWDAQDDSPALGLWQQLRALCSFAGPSDHYESKQLPALTASEGICSASCPSNLHITQARRGGGEFPHWVLAPGRAAQR